MLITLLIVGIIIFNMQNIVLDKFLNLNDDLKTSIVGARYSRKIYKTMGIQNFGNSNDSFCVYGN